MADRSNFFYSLSSKGKRVQIGAYMCGSGGFMYATSVKSLGASTVFSAGVQILVSYLAPLVQSMFRHSIAGDLPATEIVAGV